MASSKKTSKTTGKKVASPSAAVPKVPAAGSAARPARAAPQPAPKAVAGPTARNCPLVLDGEMDAEDFSPSDCLTCEEFDCRFCEAEHGSGALRSRLFAGSEDGDDEDEGWGRDLDFDGGEEAGGDEEGDEDPF